MENERLLLPDQITPPVPTILAPSVPKVPSVERQSWGVVISIIIIVLMVVIGAFYAWGKRIAEENALSAPSGLQ